MTKRDLVIRISNETSLKQQQVLEIVQKTLDYIAQAVSKYDKVELRNFGVFEVKIRKARIGRNPNAPATDVPIPERPIVKFKPGKEMRAEVLKIPKEELERRLKEEQDRKAAAKTRRQPRAKAAKSAAAPTPPAAPTA